MLIKDRRRGERRWRSHCVFLRRVKGDWNDHRWNWNPLRYNRSVHGLTKEGACSVWSGTDLCPCFYDPGMTGWARFKDTPHRSCSPYECDPRRHSHGLESRPIQEWRAEEVERGEFHSRRRRKGLVVRLHRACIRCGRSMGRERHVVGEWDHGKGPAVCPRCEKERNGFFWLNGKQVEMKDNGMPA